MFVGIVSYRDFQLFSTLEALAGFSVNPSNLRIKIYRLFDFENEEEIKQATHINGLIHHFGLQVEFKDVKYDSGAKSKHQARYEL